MVCGGDWSCVGDGMVMVVVMVMKGIKCGGGGGGGGEGWRRSYICGGEGV